MEHTKLSKDTWKAKIEKELRGKKSLDDLNYMIGRELKVDSLLQEEDRTMNDSLHSFPNQMPFGIVVNEAIDNAQTMTCLNNGGSCLLLPAISDLNLKKILENVEFKMVDIFVPDPDTLLTTLKNSISFDPSVRQNIHSIASSTTVDIQNSLAHGSLIEELTHAISDAKNFNIHLILNDSYLLNIAILRAIRIIIQKIDKTIKILTSSKKSGQSDEYDLIRFTTHTHASLAGGSNYHFYPCDHDTSLHLISKMMHVSNVINLESTIEKNADPWRGSYTIEHITKTIVKAIEKRWSRR